ncbi:protein-tyrosine phosphatase-like protein [Gautieria morchelliformis]|nr:protein-tyrosine phosphatase-like protein [Gautieria morchelliformis]
MPAAHRPPRLQPVAQQNFPKLRSLPTPLRIEHPEHLPAVTLVLEENPSSARSDQSEADSFLPPKPRSLRNQKKLSLNLSAAPSSASSASLILPDSPASIAPPVSLPPSAVASRRRPSVVSLPNGASTLAHRRDEEGSPSAPYVDGPIQILPGVWIGSEDNARDWKDLLERGIKSILNVAKEVASPYRPVAQAPLRSTVSTPNLTLKFSESTADPTYVPPHGPSGRPAMHYLRLPWSHGQADLVRGGFVDGMAFVDESLERGDGVLIHCQCGVSRSATMVIALVMLRALMHGGMHASYAFVKEKSKWVGPNMSCFDVSTPGVRALVEWWKSFSDSL